MEEGGGAGEVVTSIASPRQQKGERVWQDRREGERPDSFGMKGRLRYNFSGLDISYVELLVVEPHDEECAKKIVSRDADLGE